MLHAQNSHFHMVFLACVPATQLSVKELAASPNRRMDWSREAIIMGLNTLRSKCPWEPAMLMPTWFPTTCRVHMPADEMLNIGWEWSVSIKHAGVSC